MSGCATNRIIESDNNLNKNCDRLSEIVDIWVKTEAIYHPGFLDSKEKNYKCTNAEYENLCYKIQEKDEEISLDIIFKGSDKLYHFFYLDFLGNYDKFYQKNFLDKQINFEKIILKNIKENNKPIKVSIYGHSLGGAFAFLLMRNLYFDIIKNYPSKEAKKSVTLALKTWNMINLNIKDQEDLSLFNTSMDEREIYNIEYTINNEAQARDITSYFFTNVKSFFYGNKVSYNKTLETNGILDIINGHKSVNLKNESFKCNLIIKYDHTNSSFDINDELLALIDKIEENSLLGSPLAIKIKGKKKTIYGNTINKEYKEKIEETGEDFQITITVTKDKNGVSLNF